MSKLPSSEHRDHPTLTIQDGYGQNREAVMERNNIVIGREPDCDVVIGDQNVSRHHAVISREEEGFFIKDLNSANGTFVNSQPVTMQLIKHMDIIQMGGAMLVFNDPNNPEFARKNIPIPVTTQAMITAPTEAFRKSSANWRTISRAYSRVTPM